MEAKYLALAIKKLSPDAEFSFIEADYSTIQWDVLHGDAPKIADIEKAIKEIKDEENAQAITLANAKKAAEEKLAALGLTSEDLKVLGLA